MNYAMQEKLKRNEAIDISGCAREGKYYVLSEIRHECDYCDAITEQWIWSIGRRKADGKTLASTSPDLYQNPDYDCLWLR